MYVLYCTYVHTYVCTYIYVTYICTYILSRWAVPTGASLNNNINKQKNLASCGYKKKKKLSFVLQKEVATQHSQASNSKNLCNKYIRFAPGQAGKERRWWFLPLPPSPLPHPQKKRVIFERHFRRNCRKDKAKGVIEWWLPLCIVQYIHIRTRYCTYLWYLIFAAR